PLVREIYAPGAFQQGEGTVHTLNGVTSVQRTVRLDPAFNAAAAPEQYYLIADAGGVFEFRFDPTAPFDPRTEDHRGRLAWAFTKDDYAFATGAGWGRPNLVRDPNTGQYQGQWIANV